MNVITQSAGSAVKFQRHAVLQRPMAATRRSRGFRGVRSGFTLIELLLVLVILAVLAAIVVPKFTGRTQEAKITATKTQISNIKASLDLFEHDNGRFPSSEEGLGALVDKPGDLSNWHRYMDNVPVDGWGNAFTYRQPGTNSKDYDIISFGPDGHEGGGDDLTN